MRRFERLELSDPSAWLSALQAACLAFMFLLSIGAVFALVVKLQYPNFGSGGNPIQVFTSIVIFSLACLRVPVHIGDLTLAVVPLGALAASLIGIAWATRTAGAARPGAFDFGAAIRTGILFGGLCLLTALVFRFRSEIDPVNAGALGALLWGTAWGIGGAALGSSNAELSPRGIVRGLAGGIGSNGAIRVAAALGAGAAVGGLAVVLLWVIGVLSSEGLPRGFATGDAIAAVIYLIAFAPNLIVAVLGLSMGASVEAGTQLTVAGGLVGSSEHLSLFDWGGGPTPVYAVALVIIPVGLFTLAASIARRDERRDNWSFAAGCLVFAVGLAYLAWLGEARLGASMVGSRGFGRIASDPIEILVAAALWAVAVGVVTHYVFRRKRAGGS
jgi:hypothetical protein